ncbi:homoprotocatechuate degradation operon regulator, HpaR [compost metagenome]
MPKKRSSSRDYFDRFAEEWHNSRPDLKIEQCSMLLRVIRMAGILDRELVKTCREFGINSGQFQVLATLRRLYPSPMTPTDLGRYAILTSGTMTVLLDRLEEKGLARRVRNSTDRRSVEVELTDAGKTLIDLAIDKRMGTLLDLQSHLEQDELDSASQTLRKLLTSLDPPIEDL